jgi:hypothetical protein
MGSSEPKFVIGGLVGVAVVLGLHALLPTSGAQPLRADHTKTWKYVKAPHREATDLEQRLGEVGSLIAARPVQVRCEDFSEGTPVEPGGVVQFNGAEPADFARLRPDMCTRLVRFMRNPTEMNGCLASRSCDIEVFRSAEALTVLAHESYHLRGLQNEAVVQCYAMQAVPRAARALGANPEGAQALASREYSAGYPHMPPAYRSPGCRPGGALDLSPAPDWP